MFKKLSSVVTNWLTAPETNSAGRLGLFRIIYSIFYLWYLSKRSADVLSGIPNFYVHAKVYLLRYIFTGFSESLTPLFFHLIEAGIVFALILLAFGYKTRIATAVVLVLGCVIEALWTSVDGQRTLVILVFYVPYFMLISNCWGDTYSIDAILRSRKGQTQINPHDWKYFLPARAMLIIFSVLFFSSAIFKMGFGGAWLAHSDLMANLLLNRNIKAALCDLPLNSLAPYISQTPFIYLSLHVVTLIFESCFFLAIFSRNLRNLCISTALIFHSINALWLVVTVTPVLIGYCLFIDWQRLKDWLLKGSHSRQLFYVGNISPKLLTVIALSLAAFVSLLWNSDLGIRNLFNLWGVFDWRTIWYPVLPLSLVWFTVSVIQIVNKVKFSAGSGSSRDLQ